ncbi:hypothetical protein KI387_001697, partial [Taxus chinensis]
MVSFAQAMWPRFILRKWLLRRKPVPLLLLPQTDADDEITLVEEENNISDRLICNVQGPTHKRGQSETLWTDYTQPCEYRIFVGTWNVGGISPPENLELEKWLNTREPSDIYVIGFQEIVPLQAGKVLGSPSENGRAANKWEALIAKALNKTQQNMRSCSARAPASRLALLDSERNNVYLRHTHSTDLNFHDKISQLIKNSLSALPLIEPSYLEEGGGASTPEDKCQWSGAQHYKRIVSRQMAGLYVTVWAKSPLDSSIRNVKVSCVGCGIMGYLGNKGSISISMSLHHSTFCFVCAHLASGQNQGDLARRNSDVAEILKRTNFPRKISTIHSPRTIMGHDEIIWFGDLNYRLSLSEKNARCLIDRKDWTTLQLSDELKTEQIAGRVFQQWNEGPIDFAPTYKYAANSDEYCTCTQNNAREKCRVPAWCDRILWYGKGLKEISYERG